MQTLKLVAIAIIALIIVVLITVVVYSKTVNKRDNTWRFLAAQGNVDHYELWAITPDDDNFVYVMDIPNVVNSDGYVEFTYISPKDGVYQPRVCARDNGGNRGKWTIVGEDLNVDTSMSTGSLELVQ